MSFQWIFDYAETISMERKPVVASTVARDGTVRSVNRGNQPWRFDIKVPDGISWTALRQYISQAEALDRHTSGSIVLTNAGLTWLVGYQGNSVNSTGFIATIVQGSNTITLTTSPTTSSGFKFRAGDFIQLGTTGKVYTVAADVAFNSNTVTLHRPVLESSGSSISLRVGANCTLSVVCQQFPSWTLMARDQVSWSGPFVFYEVQ